MTVLVTGAAGFIGSRLVQRLAERGQRVEATTRRAAEVPGAARTWQVDLSDAEETRQTLAAAAPDVVYHLASHVSGGRGVELVVPTLQANLVAAVNLLVAAETVGCRRIVLAGSMEVPAPGEDAFRPHSPYAAAKTAAAAYAHMFADLYGTPALVLRVFMTYGPGQRDESKLIPYVIRSLLAGDAPRLTNGSRPVDWIYVDDVVDALLAAADAPGIEGRRIDVGSGRVHTVREVVTSLRELVGRTDVEPLYGAVEERAREVVRVADIAPAKQLLDWAPSVELEDGLARTVSWFRSR